jgi:hypothetical protein
MPNEPPAAGAALPSRRLPSRAWGVRPADGAPREQPGEAAGPELGPWPTAPVSVIVWGPEREANDLVAYAIARDLDPALFWLEVHDTPSPSATNGPARIGWVPSDHVYLANDTSDLEPRPFPVRGLREYIQGDEPGSGVDLLSGFLCLPNVVQEIASRATPSARARVIVFANTERTAALFRRSDGPVLFLLEALRESGISTVFSYAGRAPVDRLGFDVVLRVEGAAPTTSIEGEFTCERALPRGPFRVGETSPLASVPAFASAFRRYASQPRP